MTRKLQLSMLSGASMLALLAGTAVVPGRVQAHSAHEVHEGHEGHAAHNATWFAAGEPGAADAASRIIEIRIADADGKLAFLPDAIEVKQGEQIRFVLSNVGSVDHEFLIDTVSNNAVHKEAMAADPEMQHAEPNGRRLKPGEKVELVWHFTKPGSFEMACLIPGHYESGMKGRILVK
jgi:uncharacterized cupredoxin-like copper-binding protein